MDRRVSASSHSAPMYDHTHTHTHTHTLLHVSGVAINGVFSGDWRSCGPAQVGWRAGMPMYPLGTGAPVGRHMGVGGRGDANVSSGDF